LDKQEFLAELIKLILLLPTKKQEYSLKAAEMRMLWFSLRVTKLNRIHNREVRKEMSMGPYTG